MYSPTTPRPPQGKDKGQKREAFLQDIMQLKTRLQNQNRGLLHPQSPIMVKWDFTMASALFYTSFVTPFEVCLGEEATPTSIAHTREHSPHSRHSQA